MATLSRFGNDGGPRNDAVLRIDPRVFEVTRPPVDNISQTGVYQTSSTLAPRIGTREQMAMDQRAAQEQRDYELAAAAQLRALQAQHATRRGAREAKSSATNAIRGQYGSLVHPAQGASLASPGSESTQAQAARSYTDQAYLRDVSNVENALRLLDLTAATPMPTDDWATSAAKQLRSVVADPASKVPIARWFRSPSMAHEAQSIQESERPLTREQQALVEAQRLYQNAQGMPGSRAPISSSINYALLEALPFFLEGQGVESGLKYAVGKPLSAALRAYGLMDSPVAYGARSAAGAAARDIEAETATRLGLSAARGGTRKEAEEGLLNVAREKIAGTPAHEGAASSSHGHNYVARGLRPQPVFGW